MPTDAHYNNTSPFSTQVPAPQEPLFIVIVLELQSGEESEYVNYLDSRIPRSFLQSRWNVNDSDDDEDDMSEDEDIL